MTGKVGRHSPDKAKGGATPVASGPLGYDAVTFVYEATEDGVRCVLRDIRSGLAGMGLGEDFCGTAEIVLAEALNNVAEHAYPGDTSAEARVAVCLTPQGCEFDLIDKGRPMPGLSLPVGQLPPMDGPRNTLPEGGFGWFMIHTLSDRLTYDRRDGTNHVHIRLPFPPV